MSIKSVIPSNHLILGTPLGLLIGFCRWAGLPQKTAFWARTEERRKEDIAQGPAHHCSLLSSWLGLHPLLSTVWKQGKGGKKVVVSIN